MRNDQDTSPLRNRRVINRGDRVIGDGEGRRIAVVQVVENAASRRDDFVVGNSGRRTWIGSPEVFGLDSSSNVGELIGAHLRVEVVHQHDTDP